MQNKISTKAFGRIQWTVFGGFGLFNLYSAFNLFLGLADGGITPWIYGGLGVLWDLFLSVNIVLIKTAQKQVNPWKHGLRGLILTYIAVLTVGVIGAIGFHVSNTDSQAANAGNQNSAIDTLNAQLTTNKAAVTQHTITRDALNASLNTDILNNASDRIIAAKQKQIQTEEATIASLNDQDAVLANQLSNAPAKKLQSSTVFETVGRVFGGISGELIKNVFWLLIIFIVQSALFFNAPSLDVKLKVPGRSFAQLNGYVDALFDNRRGTKLGTHETALSVANIDPKEGKEIRDYLLTLNYKKQPLLTSGRGGTSTSIDTKEKFKAIVKLIIDTSGEEI